jgi:hypothetical protein
MSRVPPGLDFETWGFSAEEILTMQRQARGLGCVTLLVAFCFCAGAQGNETIEYRPERARHLSGVVTDIAGQPIPGAVVEDCDSHFKQVLTSTRTDANGQFSFSNVKYGSKHYLNVRYPAFDLDHHTVTISMFAKSKLRIRLHVGT